nr:phospholipase D-like domain-containing protein [Psychrobacter sp. ENNN9_III]
MVLDILLVIHFILLLIISLRVLSRPELTSPARLAWLVVLFVLPYIGVVVYWMFGEVHLGNGFAQRYKKIIDDLHHNNPEVLGCKGALTEAVKPEYRAAFAYSANITGFHTTLGNRAELMKDAADTRQRMIADFDAATDHIHVLYYIWRIDGMGVDTAKALIRAAKRGVTCRAMVDGMGSRKMVGSKIWQEMKDAGVQVSVALPINNPIKVLLFSRIDLRNHRKITVIDGKIGYSGSRNCADPEFRVKPNFAPWIDIMLRVEGPVVA